jgi:small conductance mechanosensitive channel
MSELENLDQYRTVAVELADLGVQYGVSIVSAIMILIAGFILASWTGRVVRRRLEAVERFDGTLVPIIAQVVRYSILVFTVILVLAQFGIQTTSIIAVLGAAGIAVGLALQGTLQNVAAGLMLLLLRPFQVGDYIETPATAGSVEEIGLFMTRLCTWKGIFVTVPNGQIWSGSIINYSRNPTRLLVLAVGISYDDDIDKALKVVLDTARKEERVLDTPEPVAMVVGYGDSSVDLQLRAWISRDDFWDVKWTLNRAVKYALDKAGITIPYPHLQVIEEKD